MKHVLNLLKAGLLALLPLLLHSHLQAASGGAISVEFPPLAGLFGASTIAVLGTVLYWLELAVRVIPTASAFTPLTLLISLLQAIVPNQATGPNGEPGTHEPTSFFRRLFHHSAPAPAVAEVYTQQTFEPESTIAPVVEPVVSPQLVASILTHLQAAGLVAPTVGTLA